MLNKRDENNLYGNIMYDRRIIRGNTYALHTLPAVSYCYFIRRNFRIFYFAARTARSN